jgi:ssDNA-binding Zn-finger/Zn-ribbon topoisomerase 1
MEYIDVGKLDEGVNHIPCPRCGRDKLMYRQKVETHGHGGENVKKPEERIAIALEKLVGEVANLNNSICIAAGLIK